MVSAPVNSAPVKEPKNVGVPGANVPDQRAGEQRDDHHAAGDALDRALDGKLHHGRPHEREPRGWTSGAGDVRPAGPGDKCRRGGSAAAMLPDHLAADQRVGPEPGSRVPGEPIGPVYEVRPRPEAKTPMARAPSAIQIAGSTRTRRPRRCSAARACIAGRTASRSSRTARCRPTRRRRWKRAEAAAAVHDARRRLDRLRRRGRRARWRRRLRFRRRTLRSRLFIRWRRRRHRGRRLGQRRQRDGARQQDDRRLHGSLLLCSPGFHSLTSRHASRHGFPPRAVAANTNRACESAPATATG